MLQELIESSFDKNTEGVFTAIPGIVVRVRDNFQNLYIDVQPAINDNKRDGSTTERPVVLNVPVQMPSSSKAALTLPIAPGDPVLLIYSMRGVDVWKRGDGYPQTPSDFRKFDKRDCFAIPGVWPISRSVNNPSKHSWDHNPQDVVLVNNLGATNEVEVRLKQDGNVLIRTRNNVSIECDNAEVVANTSASITTPDLTIDAANCLWTGNVTHVGTFTFNGVNFSTHRHTPSTVPPSNP